VFRGFQRHRTGPRLSRPAFCPPSLCLTSLLADCPYWRLASPPPRFDRADSDGAFLRPGLIP